MENINKFKIEKIELSQNKKDITVWTNAFSNLGFGFKVNEIVDKDDLKEKIKERVKETLEQHQGDQEAITKFNTLKNLESEEVEL